MWMRPSLHPLASWCPEWMDQERPHISFPRPRRGSYLRLMSMTEAGSLDLGSLMMMAPSEPPVARILQFQEMAPTRDPSHGRLPKSPRNGRISYPTIGRRRGRCRNGRDRMRCDGNFIMFISSSKFHPGMIPDPAEHDVASEGDRQTIVAAPIQKIPIEVIRKVRGVKNTIGPHLRRQGARR